MSEVEAKRITALLIAAYPGWKPSEATMQLYERLLRPFAGALAERAVAEIIRSPREFAPPVGVICDRAARLALERGGEQALGAEEAWAELSAAIRSHGMYRPPNFSSPALVRTVAAMEWAEICSNPNLEATRAHFFRLFTAFQDRRVTRQIEEMSAGTQCAQLPERWSAALEVKGRGRCATGSSPEQE
ncbi:MAG TPA: hypothetical protein VFE56_04205 [Candidatus Binataceae bacterium]|jgi:hypothetical protein|nr:hypothetical protein [Candidatus Binataceae bacterium]